MTQTSRIDIARNATQTMEAAVKSQAMQTSYIKNYATTGTQMLNDYEDSDPTEYDVDDESSSVA